MKRIRITTLIGYAFLTFLFTNCTPDSPDEPEPPATLEFPATYHYQQLDYHPTRFYVLGNTGYSEIAAVGTYASFESDYQPAEKLKHENTEFPLKSFTLQADSTATVWFFDENHLYHGDPAWKYHLEDDLLTLTHSGPPVAGSYLIPSGFAEDFTTWTAWTFMYHYSKKVNGQTTYSPVFTSFEHPDLDDFIAGLRAEKSLSAGDTILINYSGYLFDQE